MVGEAGRARALIGERRKENSKHSSGKSSRQSGQRAQSGRERAEDQYPAHPIRYENASEVVR
jgi:hypothetical protein